MEKQLEMCEKKRFICPRATFSGTLKYEMAGLRLISTVLSLRELKKIYWLIL